MATLTEHDIATAKPMATQLMALATTQSPTEAVAALALALAGVVHLAGGEPEPVVRLFVDTYRAISADMARKMREGD